MSRARRLLVLVIGLPLAAVAGLVAVNAFDPEATPEALALFKRRVVPFVPESGWALIAGFHAPAGEEPRAFASGRRQVAARRKPGARPAAAVKPLEVRAADELLCIPQEEDCVRKYAHRPESAAELASDNAVLLARYDELLRLRQLADVVELFDYYEAAVPHFSTVLRTQQVRLSEVGARVATGRVDEALAWLEADAAFHRLWLEEAGSLFTKMMAVRSLSRDFLLAGQVARSGHVATSAQWAILDRLAAPLTPPQRGVAPVLRFEAELFAGVLDQLIADSRTTSRIIEAPRLGAAIAAATLRRNATLNFAQPTFAGWLTLDAIPADQLPHAVEAIETRMREHLQPDWTWAYNFTGRGFVAEARPQFAEYVYRVRDLDALGSLVRCAIRLRRDGVAREAAAAFVASSAECIDPYTRRALEWDAERGEVSYKPRSPGQVKRFGGRGERVAFAVYPS